MVASSRIRQQTCAYCTMAQGRQKPRRACRYPALAAAPSQPQEGGGMGAALYLSTAWSVALSINVIIWRRGRAWRRRIASA